MTTLSAEAARIAELMAQDASAVGDHETAAKCWIVAADNWKAHGTADRTEAYAARLARSRCWRRAGEAADRTADAEEVEPEVTQSGGAA